MALPSSFHVYRSIGLIRTPYRRKAPYQPVETAEGDFRIVLERPYAEGLTALETFDYIYVIYALDRVMVREDRLLIRPPWAPEQEVGVFASRSPRRPNPIGISVVRLLSIRDNVLYTGGLDAFDGTPVLDIKPYLMRLDAKCDANYGWAGRVDDEQHLALHIKGIPHDF